MGNRQLIIIIIFSLILVSVLIFLVSKHVLKSADPAVNVIDYQTYEPGMSADARQITSRPMLLGIEKNFINDEELYFDDGYLYAVNKMGQCAVFDLKNITDLRRTSIQISNRPVWQIIIVEDNGSIVNFKFLHNYTIWNKDFADFHARVRHINPKSVKSQWSLWRM